MVRNRSRKDLKCGSYYPLPDGIPGQCDPDGDKPCCSHYWHGNCGRTTAHCSCYSCTNYTRIYKEWKESNGTQKWRYDGRCGIYHPLPDGTPAQCDPDGENPCCDSWRNGKCGKTTAHCSCEDCTNYTRLYRGGTQKWRYDGRCGIYFTLPDGTPAQCDPAGKYPCCNKYGFCNYGTIDCLCHRCVDYRVFTEIEKSGENCTVARLHNGFLKNVCFVSSLNEIRYQCAGGVSDYKVNYKFGLVGFSEVCDNDQHFYQACGFNTEKTNTDVLCGGYICEEKEGGEHKFIKCSGDNCKPENRDCSTTRDTSPETNCDGTCNYKYGVTCVTRWGGRFNVPVYWVCDGREICNDGSDEQDCTVTNNTVYTCTHYMREVEDSETIAVPIHNYTRCSVVNFSKRKYPYCFNYLDQTNCSDIERVGGYCEVNGYMSTVSKYMVCYDFDKRINENVTLCDDDIQNQCVSPSTSDCRVHKHLMCDGVADCSDGSDETQDMCDVTTELINFVCKRRFQLKIGKTVIPLSWIVDNVTDCLNGEDENISTWKLCPGKVSSFAGTRCKKVFVCPGVSDNFVNLDQLCNGLESCGNDGGENKVCKIARDFPEINTAAGLSSNLIRNVCQSNTCELRSFDRPWGPVFGERLNFSVPKTKVNCSVVFGEYYLYLSCMDLCVEEKILCPLEGENKKLEYDSCPGQYPNRAYTLGNNSFLTFVVKSNSGNYHQNFYQCNNSKCIEYNQVCDLVDDCGDMSDELNCANHMICEDTKNLTRHQFISWSQKCDGIYDCFDLSDECNDSCTRRILHNWQLRLLCWIMGLLAVLFNGVTVSKGMMYLMKLTNKTSSLLVLYNKTLVCLIECGDFLIGTYLIILSVYDSLIFKDQYCHLQPEWLTGTPCLILGVISTIGSQVSVFAMTILSVIRSVAIIRNVMTHPIRMGRKPCFYATTMVLAITFLSSAVAFLPLLPSLENYFVQGMYYDHAYKIFIGFPNKNRHIDVLRAYYNRKNTSSSITSDMSWQEIGEKVDGMFTQDYGNLTRRPVHFYGNDGVCLFKYFVRTDDARKNRQSPGSGIEMNDGAVWTMLFVNLFCFILMNVSYFALLLNRRKTSINTSGGNRQEKLQIKVSIILLTDFMCWVPFIIICAAHNLGHLDATNWYVPFAMIMLPLNSVINPLIYDDYIGKLFGKFCVYVRRYIMRINMDLQIWRNQNPSLEVEQFEEIELEIVEDNS